MTNAEFFKEELREIINENGEIAVDKKTGKPIRCFGTECRDCYLNTIEGENDCGVKGYKWLLAEHKEYPKLTRYEFEVLKRAENQGLDFIARDKSYVLYAYGEQVSKGIVCWMSSESDIVSKIFADAHDFEFVKWEDEEMWSIQELLDNCEVEK